MKKQPLSHLLLISTLCIICFGTVLGTTLFKPIRASINPNYTYTLNGKTILQGNPAILYKGRFYAPIDSLTNTLGYNVSIQEDRAILTSPKDTSKDSITLNEAVITAIDFAANRITVYPKGKANTIEDQIDLYITPQTLITDGSGKYQYNITNLTTDMVVKVTYSPQMTKSIPPQANALTIRILGNPNYIQPR